MTIENYNRMEKDSLYQFSAIPFIDKLINLSIPLSAITTNDWHCNTMPRIYVTREYGRNKGGQSRKAHVMQFGDKTAKRLSNFYHN